MVATLDFLGAAQNVTGSCYAVDTGESRILVDCGMYQERDFRERNWKPFAVPPSEVHAVVLTHAHVDHCGLLPKLVHEGFTGKVYCTPATAEIVRIVLPDSAKIQEEDAKHKRKRHAREGRKGPYPEEPLYRRVDAEACFPLLQPVGYGKAFSPAPGVEAVFSDAGHILGSSSVRMVLSNGGEERSLVFSGDVGRWGAPILDDPTPPDQADYVVIESTYGNRDHEGVDETETSLADIINETRAAGGKLIIPSFAIERTQELLYRMSLLLAAGKIPRIRVFVDSPMAIRVTDVFKRHLELFDEDAQEMLRSGKHPCDFPGLTMSRTVDESKAINSDEGFAVVIAGSGMCTGGRIKHHLAHHIGRKESTVAFVGYQAKSTLGRIILEGAREVRLFGQPHPVRARIAKMHGFSAHADRQDLLRWLSGLSTAPRKVIVTHGEAESAKAFAELVEKKLGWQTHVAAYREPVAID